MSDDLHRALGRIEGKQEIILEEIKKVNKDHNETKERVGKVEKKISYVAGAAAMVATFFSFSFKVIYDMFKSGH